LNSWSVFVDNFNEKSLLSVFLQMLVIWVKMVFRSVGSRHAVLPHNSAGIVSYCSCFGNMGRV
jgi:hypothetical protein